MTTRPVQISFADFEKDIQSVFDRIREIGEPVLVVRDQEVYRIERTSGAFTGYDVQRTRRALEESAGALRGVDRDELLTDIYAQRDQNDRVR